MAGSSYQDKGYHGAGEDYQWTHVQGPSSQILQVNPRDKAGYRYQSDRGHVACHGRYHQQGEQTEVPGLARAQTRKQMNNSQSRESSRQEIFESGDMVDGFEGCDADDEEQPGYEGDGASRAHGASEQDSNKA
jgi:hypothetical protein